MDPRTWSFYARYADPLMGASEPRRSAMLPHIERSIPVGATVLDVGAGSGRDVAAMLALGRNAFGVEPHEAMREKAFSLHPSLRGRLRPAMLPALGRPFCDVLPEGFDAVICSAVLMHVDPAELPAALASLVHQLRSVTSKDDVMSTPALLISLPSMDASRLVDNRDRDGRWFYNHDPEEVRAQLAALDMALERSATSEEAFASTGTVWRTLVFRRAQITAAGRPFSSGSVESPTGCARNRPSMRPLAGLAHLVTQRR